MLKATVDKFRDIEVATSAEKGAYALFALFLRNDAPGKWDLLVSAPWIETKPKEAFEYLSRELQKKLSLEEYLTISKIVYLESGNPLLEAIHTAIGSEHGSAHFVNCTFNDIELDEAYIITSQRIKSKVA